MSITQQRVVDQEVLDVFMDRFVQELGAASQVPTVIIGDRLGLYRALDEVGPCTSAELATATGTYERYVREWLRGQAAGGYVSYDPGTDEYYLTAEQSFTLAQPDSPAYIPGAFLTVAATVRAVPAITEAFTTAPDSVGTNIIPTSSRASSASFGPATPSTWCPPGCRRSTVWSRS